MLSTPTVKTAFFSASLSAWGTRISEAADSDRVRGAMPNSQHFLKSRKVGNQYLFLCLLLLPGWSATTGDTGSTLDN